MRIPFILASASEIRRLILVQAGLHPIVVPARIDEAAVMASLLREGASAVEVADTLAELKARKVAEKKPAALVLGCDQVLVLGDRYLSKPDSPAAAVLQLQDMRGQRHQLVSAMVLYEAGRPVWRHVGKAQMTMKALTDAQIERYVSDNWDSIQHAVGCYKIEEAGHALFSAVEGDMTTIQGLPLPPLMQYLSQRGFLPT